MNGRRSKRLASKQVKRNAEASDNGAPGGNWRDNVGGALGVMPKKGAKENLHQAEPAETAVAARLDEFNAEVKRGITQRKKRRKSKNSDAD